MATVAHEARPGLGTSRLAYYLRVLRVIAAVEFKMKYAGSALGYIWSLAKPLSYFAVLWFVFGRVFDTGIADFPLYLLLGIVLYTYLVDACSLALASIVSRGPLLRRIAFPPLIIPISVSLTALLTFGINLLAVAIFFVSSHVWPELDWVLVLPLFVELYAFALGVGLILATLFVRLRDVGILWELTAQLLLFATPIMYPISMLPEWAQRVAFLNPFVQIVQDVRYVMIGPDAPQRIAADVLGGPAGHLLPITIAFGVLAIGLRVFRRNAPKFAEWV
jgi:ABC-2 type transport system permease protein